MVVKIADENAVSVAESVVHARHVMGSGEFGRWIPTETGGIEPIAHAGSESVGQRLAVDQTHDGGITANAQRIVAEDVVGGHAGGNYSASANGNAGKQVASGVHQAAGIAG